MKNISISDIYENNMKIHDSVTISGWIRSRRTSKSGFSFLSVYDGSCLSCIQIIAYDTLHNYTTEILNLTIGCSIVLTGKLILSIGKEQKYEIQATKISVLGWIENPHTYPISAKKHSMEYLREVSHLRPRTNLIGAITRLRHNIFQILQRFLHKNGYYWVPTPVITGLNAEGAGDMFHVSTLDINHIPKNKQGAVDFKKDFFGKESFLTVSGQLNIEAYACSLSKVYTFGPTFRAENSNTSRHLAEFWMLEVEAAFLDISDISDFAEKMLKYICSYLLRVSCEDLTFLQNNIDSTIFTRLETLSSSNFIRLEYKDAIKILLDSKINFERSIIFGVDLSSEHERFLVEKYFNTPVILQNYPKNLKAFYMRLNDDQKTVAAIDILVPGIGELIGGSQREERLSILNNRLIESGLKKEDYWWYLDLRRYGTVPHSGFGMGFERLLAYITGLSNVKDVVPFPRTVKNANF